MSDYNVSVEMELIVEQFNQSAQKAQKQIKDLTQKEKNLGDEAVKTSNKLGTEEQALKKVGREADITGKKVGLMGKVFGGIKGQLMSFVGVLGGAFAIKKIVTDLADLSLMIGKIQANTHASTKEMDDMYQVMLDLSKTKMFSMDELMHTAFAKSKTDNIKNIKNEMIDIVNIATAMPEKSMDIANNLMTSLKSVFKDFSSTELADLVVRTIEGANMSTQEYVEALTTASIASTNFKMSLKEINAVIATLAETGSAKGANVSTILVGLGSTLSNIGQNKKGLMALRMLGLSAKDISPQLNKTSDIITKLGTALNKLDAVKKQALLTAIFGQGKQSSQIASLFDQIELFQKKLEQQDNAKMTAAGVAKAQEQSLGGSVARLGASMTGLIYAMKPLEPIIIDIVNVLVLFLNAIGSAINFITKPLGLGYNFIRDGGGKENQDRFKNSLAEMEKTQPKTLNEVFNQPFAKLSQMGGNIAGNIGNSIGLIANDIIQSIPNMNIKNTKQDNKITVVLESKTPDVMATVVQNSTPNGGNVEVQKRNFINS
jgi:hypothetical protein